MRLLSRREAFFVPMPPGQVWVRGGMPRADGGNVSGATTGRRAGADPGGVEAFGAGGPPRAVWWDAETSSLRVLDQTLLPTRVEVRACEGAECVAEAIETLR